MQNGNWKIEALNWEIRNRIRSGGSNDASWMIDLKKEMFGVIDQKTHSCKSKKLTGFPFKRWSNFVTLLNQRSQWINKEIILKKNMRHATIINTGSQELECLPKTRCFWGESLAFLKQRISILQCLQYLFAPWTSLQKHLSKFDQTFFQQFIFKPIFHGLKFLHRDPVPAYS